jgi:NADH-quinone oxidoreductase subunit J
MESNAFREVIFWALAVATVGGALLVVHVRDVFRAALALVVAFLGVAGLFVLLSAEFLAVVQVLIYAGAISVLLIFAVMLTRDVRQGNRSTSVQPVALTVGVLLLMLLLWGIVQEEWDVLPVALPGTLQQVFVETPQRLGKLLVQDYVLPFEIAGVVLLAAAIGALGLVREHSEMSERREGGNRRGH